jgi:hypothetical protein
MARPLTPYAFVFGLALSSGMAARADDYPECAKIDNPLAYNQCLANHGPAAHATRGIAPPPAGADGPKGGWRASAPTQGRTESTMQMSRTHGGRMVLEFNVGGPSAGARKHKETR